MRVCGSFRRSHHVSIRLCLPPPWDAWLRVRRIFWAIARSRWWEASILARIARRSRVHSNHNCRANYKACDEGPMLAPRQAITSRAGAPFARTQYQFSSQTWRGAGPFRRPQYFCCCRPQNPSSLTRDALSRALVRGRFVRLRPYFYAIVASKVALEQMPLRWLTVSFAAE